jgi:dUTP pyrophosphatase
MRGDRIAQMIVAPVVQARLVEVDDLSSSDRGTGGFGSTGVSHSQRSSG